MEITRILGQIKMAAKFLLFLANEVRVTFMLYPLEFHFVSPSLIGSVGVDQ